MNIADRVEETTAATNTATIVLAGVTKDMQAFSSTFQVGTTDIPISIDNDAGAWLNGMFTLTGENLLTRQSISSSSNNGGDVTFPAGSKRVTCTLLASEAKKLAAPSSPAVTTLPSADGATILVVKDGAVRQISVANFLKSFGVDIVSLDAAGTLQGADIMDVGQNGIEKRTTLSAVAAYVASTLDLSQPAPVDNAPSLTAASATVTGPTSATGSVTTNEVGGTLYWLFSAASSATSTEVKAGINMSVTAIGAQSVSSTTLTASTQYYLHFLHRDTANQDSAVLTAGPFTTQAAGSPSPTVTSVTVSPTTANVAGGATQQYTATVAGTNSPSQGVNWTCTAGTINSSGLFTAPAATTSEQTITITATSQQNSTKTGTATATVAVVSAVSYTYAPYNGTNAVKTSVLTSMGTTSDEYRYYYGSDNFVNAYWNVTPTPASMVGGWGTSPTVPPAEITPYANTAAGGRNNGMIPLVKATGQAWGVHNTYLWVLDGAAGPFYYWLKPIDGAPYCLNPSAPLYITVG